MIVLTTFNAKYIHASFGLRYLYANLGELQAQTKLVEFTIHTRPIDAAEEILALQPTIIGLGIYIWNVRETLEFVEIIRQLAPEVVVVLGGPEVSHETAGQPLVELADYTITGEADHAFRDLCQTLLRGEKPLTKIIHAAPPEPDSLQFPYAYYSDDDLKNRVVYVEASRGCPFRCEFCLSSLDKGVRTFDTAEFLNAMEGLWNRGLRQFKFVDRTFNIRVDFSTAILEFFLERLDENTFIHFEMIPDRLPDELRDIVAKFPAGALQFEVGIQTFDAPTAARISRRQNYEKLADNFTFLRDHTGVHVHADLIVGLPGETLESFGQGFDRLVALGPQEIQVGILKRLRGTPIIRHDDAFEVRWSPTPPYEILSNSVLDFPTMQQLRRFSRYWDLVGNSGHFPSTLPLLWSDGTPFQNFFAFSNWLHETAQTTHGISLKRLVELLFQFLTEVRGIDADTVGLALLADWRRGRRYDTPNALKPWADQIQVTEPNDQRLPERQQRHL
ncbi:MAG: DUF4080 domain-containing protein [bacterium]